MPAVLAGSAFVPPRGVHRAGVSRLRPEGSQQAIRSDDGEPLWDEFRRGFTGEELPSTGWYNRSADMQTTAAAPAYRYAKVKRAREGRRLSNVPMFQR
jgi:hypothetical protein